MLGDLPIVTVLKSGGDYSIDHVRLLYDQLRARVPRPFTFACLTDCVGTWGPVHALPLRHGLPGWWSKIELFRVFERAFYLDLDTLVLGDIHKLLIPRTGFWMLEDFTHPGRGASGVMAWSNEHYHLYNSFMSAPDTHMRAHASRLSWGDQGFITAHLHAAPQLFQRHYPGLICSYKVHYLRGQVDDRCRILCFHGKPRPWDLPQPPQTL